MVSMFSSKNLNVKSPRIGIISVNICFLSSIALDIFKQLYKIPLNEPLKSPLKEHEEIQHPHGILNIIKDISELSIEDRQKWLQKAFQDTGSYLIISNTGPLIDSFNEFVKRTKKDPGIESKLLKALDQPLSQNSFNQNYIKDFEKDLIILNLTRQDNVIIASRILQKMIQHPAWNKCQECLVEQACPIQLNIRALRERLEYVLERVQWIYQRVNAFDQRLTLRQIVAHLAFSITGNMSCEESVNRI
jgi:hypothetical protein